MRLQKLRFTAMTGACRTSTRRQRKRVFTDSDMRRRKTGWSAFCAYICGRSVEWPNWMARRAPKMTHGCLCGVTWRRPARAMSGLIRRFRPITPGSLPESKDSLTIIRMQYLTGHRGLRRFCHFWCNVTRAGVLLLPQAQEIAEHRACLWPNMPCQPNRTASIRHMHQMNGH